MADSVYRSGTPQPSDEELVDRVRARDEVALNALLTRHDEMIRKVATGFVRDQVAVQEVLQDVYLSAWRKLPAFEGRSQVSSWLYRVTVNASLMFLRGRNRRMQMAIDDVASDDLSRAVERMGCPPPDRWSRDPGVHLESQELRRQIQRAVENLPAGLRDVFLVRHVEGCSTEETARSLGMTAPAVKTRLHRARAALRENLKAYLTV